MSPVNLDIFIEVITVTFGLNFLQHKVLKMPLKSLKFDLWMSAGCCAKLIPVK